MAIFVYIYYQSFVPQDYSVEMILDQVITDFLTECKRWKLHAALKHLLWPYFVLKIYEKYSQIGNIACENYTSNGCVAYSKAQTKQIIKRTKLIEDVE